MPKLKTPLSFYGGKGRIATRIAALLNEIPHKVYVEPFFGGGAVLYAKGVKVVSNAHDYREAINDINGQLITFWRVAREQPEELARWIATTPYSQEEYRESLGIYRNPSTHSDLKVAWAVFIQCNMSFSKKIGAGWATGMHWNGCNHASSWLKRVLRLPECFERLRDVHVGCEDAVRFIERFDAVNGLIYADPPYLGTEQGHYGGYDEVQYRSLCATLDNCKSSYILSNYSQDIFPESAQKCVEIEAAMSAAGGKNLHRLNTKRVEKLWICDRSS